MARFGDHVKEQIRERADLADVIGYYVPLQQKGHDFKGRCPFHEEKTASFLVHTTGRYAGFWKCFGCGAKGDVFTFVKMIERVTFPEAVRILAERYGIPLEPEREGAGGGKADLYRALDRAAAIYEKALWSASELGEKGRRYVESRGITEQTAREFRLGIAPPEWDRLTRRLEREGMPAPLLAEAGLARRRDRSEGYYDFLRDRLIFPIFDAQGRVIALAGRAFGDNGPKYLNTAETATFRKREILYGFDRAWRRRDKPDRLILVEGYTDVILAHQAGFPGAVACLGTAFGSEHCPLVRRARGPLLLLFDGDAAGERAALRTFEVVVREGIEAEVAVLPDGMDPADLIVQRGAEAFAEALEQRMPAIDFVIDVVKRQQGEGGSQVAAAETLVPLIAAAPDRLRREDLIRHVAGRLGFSTAAIEERVEASRDKENQRRQWKRRAPKSEGRPTRASREDRTGPGRAGPGDEEEGQFEEGRNIVATPPGALERAAAQLLVLAPEALLAEMPELATGQGVEHPQCRSIVRVAAEMFAKHGSCSPQQVLDALPDGLREAAVGILLGDLPEPEQERDLETEVREVAARLRRRARTAELRRLRLEQAEAARSGDLERAEALLREQQRVARSQGDP